MADNSILNVNTFIVVCSSFATVGAMWLNNKNIIKNIEDKVVNFKTDMEKHIKTEKTHAMELANQRMSRVEDDLKEIKPVLETTKDGVKKNCLQIQHILQNCEKNHE